MEIKNLFAKGRMNKDLDERLVPNGEYTDALNIRVSNSSGSDVGAIENEKGNLKVTAIPSDDNLQCIGSCVDEPNEKIYWFVVDDNGKSAIYEYDNKNDVTTTVLKDDRTGSDQVLNFDPQYKITGANVIFNKNNEKHLLIFTDNLNPPRMVNIERAKEYGVSNFDEDDINLYKKPPRTAPTVTPYNLSTSTENSIRERIFSFSYRYKYLDGEYSALSAFTNYQFYPGLYELDFETFENLGMLNQYNAYDIEYNTGDKRVTDIQLCFKSPLSGVVFVIDTINKEQNNLLNNATRSYRFTNKQIYRALPDDELNRVFDNVPIKALAQDIIEDRVVFGNYETQYDIKENESDETDIQINYAVELRSANREGELQTYTLAQNDEHFVMDFTGLTLNEGFAITIHVDLTSDLVVDPGGNYHNGTFQGTNTFILESNYTGADGLAASSEFLEFLDVMTANFTRNFETTSKTGYDIGTIDGFVVSGTPTSTQIVLRAPQVTHTHPTDPDILEKFEWQSESNWYLREISNILSLKSNRTYQYGIVYLDKYGRYSSVIPNSGDLGSDDSVISVPAEFSTNINKSRITITHKAPYWADRYKFFVKTNRDVYYNIFATTFYEEGVYRWVLLNGNNQHKIEAGMNLVVKQDHDGPVETLVKCKVLEVTQKTGADVVESTEGWLIGNTDADDQPIKELQGTYMKIRPLGFNMNFNINNFFAYSGKGKAFFGNVSTTLGVETEDVGIMQRYDGTAWTSAASNIDLNAGSRIKFKFESYDTLDRDGDETRYYEKEWVVQNDYTYLSGVSSLERWLLAETNWAKPGGQTYYEDPNEQFRLQFVSNAGRISLEVTSTETTNLFTEAGYITATINVQRTDGVVVFETEPKEIDEDFYYETEQVFDITNGFHTGNVQTQTSSLDAVVDIDYGNCYSFGNGVESLSVKDERFSSTLATDYRTNLVLLDGYRRVRFKNGLIYSGSFNENSSYTSLNEFNSSRGNVKFMDLKYGSIQKLFARETDLLVLQEDQVSKILYGKNIINSPDGSGSLAQIEQILGQTVPYAGEYGIAQNPESFAEYGGNIYFTDALRGAVLRLGANGVTPISNTGMEGYFRDNLSQYVDKFNLGGFDPMNTQYVLSMNSGNRPLPLVEFKCGSQFTRIISAGAPYTYTVDVGTTPGIFSFRYTANADGVLEVTHNGVTTNHNITQGTHTYSITFSSADLAADPDATVRISSSSGNLEIQLEHICAQPADREVVVMVLNDIDDAGKTIMNRYSVAGGPFYEETDIFANDGIARNEALIGNVDNPYIPKDGDTILVSSYREFRAHTGFFNSCSRFGYLVTPSILTPTQVQASPSTTWLAQTDTPANDIFQETTGSFTFNPNADEDILYIIFDYQDGACTPTDEGVPIDDEGDTNVN